MTLKLIPFDMVAELDSEEAIAEYFSQVMQEPQRNFARPRLPYVVYLTASFYEVPMGDFKQNDKAEFSSKFYATYIKQQVNGQDVLEVDAMANIYKVGGVDKLDLYRTNIGG